MYPPVDHQAELACSPHHSWEYEDKRETQLKVIDACSPMERELIHEFGFDRAMRVCRVLYGRWTEARAVLEEERRMLQVERWKNIKGFGLRR